MRNAKKQGQAKPNIKIPNKKTGPKKKRDGVEAPPPDTGHEPPG